MKKDILGQNDWLKKRNDAVLLKNTFKLEEVPSCHIRGTLCDDMAYGREQVRLNYLKT